LKLLRGKRVEAKKLKFPIATIEDNFLKLTLLGKLAAKIEKVTDCFGCADI
jgi:hypothetical protein